MRLETAIPLTATTPDSSLSYIAYVIDPGPGEVLIGAASDPYYAQGPVYGVSVGAHTIVARAVRGSVHTDSPPVAINVQAAVAATLAQKSGVVLYQEEQTSWNGQHALVQATLVDQNPRWWRNYTPTPQGIADPLPGGGQFLPMIPFPAFHPALNPHVDYSPTPTAIAQCIANAHGYIATWAEPDGFGFSVAESVAGWHTLVTDPGIIAWRAAGGKLIGPYTVSDGSGAGSYFQQFLAGVAANGDPEPDEYSLDKYGSDAASLASNVATIMTRVNNYHTAFPTKQLWLLEYDIIAGFSQASDQLQIDFMAAMRAQLDPLPWITGDFWFYQGPKNGVAAFGSSRAASLYNDDGTITIAGTAWKQLGR